MTDSNVFIVSDLRGPYEDFVKEMAKLGYEVKLLSMEDMEDSSAKSETWANKIYRISVQKVRETKHREQ